MVQSKKKRKEKQTTKTLVQLAVWIALTVSLSLMVMIPVPMANGVVTLCEVGIYSAAFIMGKKEGFFVGALSGGLIDFLSGFSQWMLFSFFIHGLQGYVAGYFFEKKRKQADYIAFLSGSIVMIGGYFLATTVLYTFPAGIASILGNSIQNLFGIGVTQIVLLAWKKKKTKRYDVIE